MKLKTTNENYSAIVVRMGEQLPVPNSDRLRGWKVNGSFVITNSETNTGDLKLYFPLECQINSTYLSELNSFRHSHLNKDKDVPGYFEDNARVRAVRLRGNVSNGIVLPLEGLKGLGIDYTKLKEGDTFNEIDGINICKKYYIRSQDKKPQSTGKPTKKFNAVQDFIERSHFKFHVSTTQFGRVLHTYNPSDEVTITYKLHGTSGISGKLPVIQGNKFWNKIKKFFGIKPKVKYEEVYSSRTVIKSLKKDSNHYYGVDIWESANKLLQPYIEDGITFYYEIVGYLPNSTSYIQKGYDYSCNPGEFKIYIYRITQTFKDGRVHEFSSSFVERFCKYHNLNMVPIIYKGTLKDYLPFTDKDSLHDWRNRLSDLFISKYTDKDCYMCKNSVPEEGVVIRIDSTDKLFISKLKSNRFYEYETKLLDAGEENIEDSQNSEEDFEGATPS